MLQKLKNKVHLLESLGMSWRLGFPGKKMIVIGVTGTDGKTTTATLIHHILTVAGIKACLSSTLASPHTTTPGRGRLQRFLDQGLKNGCTHAVLEVTSIAVDQHRIWGIPFEIGVLTNIANNEHLDYHGSFEKYRDAKLNFLKGCKTVVANSDDESINLISPKNLITYGIKKKANITPKTTHYQTKLLGEFNTYNILASIAVAKILGINDAIIAKSIKTFTPPRGRLEIITKRPFTVIVDFAHTPQAFEKVLPVAKKLGKKKLIHVFGATGDRDRTKRPVMAQVSAKFSDYIVLTHEDTYSEDPKKIISEIETGLKQKGYLNYEVNYDRRQAIKTALEKAEPGDVVIITGVGHQKSLNIKGKEIPWSDQNTVKELMKND